MPMPVTAKKKYHCKLPRNCYRNLSPLLGARPSSFDERTSQIPERSEIKNKPIRARWKQILCRTSDRGRCFIIHYYSRGENKFRADSNKFKGD